MLTTILCGLSLLAPAYVQPGGLCPTKPAWSIWEPVEICPVWVDDDHLECWEIFHQYQSDRKDQYVQCVLACLPAGTTTWCTCIKGCEDSYKADMEEQWGNLMECAEYMP